MGLRHSNILKSHFLTTAAKKKKILSYLKVGSILELRLNQLKFRILKSQDYQISDKESKLKRVREPKNLDNNCIRKNILNGLII